ncbi:hypothetical protein EB796_007874 [Bugula neritina]|uniref:Uncharacterized protein n=1 Tax=Bugula neritina TaxID=10212 RepID=A0A7J7K6D7_BUGNE|nr:hypothetical protein EB796_007874 [Bugula neritina]
MSSRSQLAYIYKWWYNSLLIFSVSTCRDCGLYDAVVLTKKLINQEQEIQKQMAEFRQQVTEFMGQLKMTQ